MKSRYGLSQEQYDAMLATQRHACAICAQPFGSTKNTHIDHCHRTGKVRGLLCLLCNSGLGKFRDDSNLLACAIEYLRQ